ncbi:unnamed protein product [Acanthosepion pharaonis]|uniref:Uncharacterized protein n=1 Tax=Acanthosepion pharaonis TaxID=158019 RepID=A0A812C878_ACAPH|nr:unnamed protein product [Sepia pharaonis]
MAFYSRTASLLLLVTHLCSGTSQVTADPTSPNGIISCGTRLYISSSAEALRGRLTAYCSLSNISVCLSIYLSLFISIYLCLYLSIFVYIYLSLFISIYLSQDENLSLYRFLPYLRAFRIRDERTDILTFVKYLFFILFNTIFTCFSFSLFFFPYRLSPFLSHVSLSIHFSLSSLPLIGSRFFLSLNFTLTSLSLSLF